MAWTVNNIKKTLPRYASPVLVSGLPGIGNVGKIAIDFIIESLHAEKIMTFTSPSMPTSVFITEENLLELPSIELYAATLNARLRKNGAGKRKSAAPDLLLLTGDVQPAESVLCHDFCQAVLGVAKKLGVAQIVTTGGIGLPQVKGQPRLYCTGTSRGSIKRFVKGSTVRTDLYGSVGPIVGVSGMLVAMGPNYRIPSMCLLAETVGHPMYLGIRGAKEIIRFLSARFAFDVDLKELNAEIRQLEQDMRQEMQDVFLMGPPHEEKLKKYMSRMNKDVTYIG